MRKKSGMMPEKGIILRKGLIPELIPSIDE